MVLVGKMVFSRTDIRWAESLMYEGMVGIRGFKMSSKNAEIFPVSPLYPLTIGLIPGGFLCNFFRKYSLCVRVFSGGVR